jgi:hypothetical protein
MGNLKYKFLILATLASTFSWAAPPRITADPRENCELLLATGRQVTLPGAKGFFKKTKITKNEMTFLLHNMRDFFSIGEKLKRNRVYDPQLQTELSEMISKRGKSHEDLLAHAKVIQNVNPDIFLGLEIDGEGMLEYFNENYLGKSYFPFLQQEDTKRKATSVVKDMGFLFRPELPFTIRYFSHRHLSYRNPINGELFPLYFRDLPVLEIWSPNSSRRGVPAFIFIAAHLKSKKRKAGQVDEGELRATQFEWIVSVIENRRDAYGEDVNIIVAGDFNTDMNATNGVLRRFFKRTGLINPFNIPQFFSRKRTTHIHFDQSSGQAEPAQLDAFLVSKSFIPRVKDIRVHLNRNADGSIRPEPRNHDQKGEDISDHYAEELVIDTRDLF